MEARWRWTSSVFLLLALNICTILSQNVGPNCQLPPQALQGEPLRDCNPGFGNPQLQMNNLFLYPPNGLAPGPALECQGSCMQCSPNQPSNVVPISQSSCGNLGPLNSQALQCASCTGPPGPPLNIPGPLLPFNQPFFAQDQCPIGPVTPCMPQQNFNQGMLPGPCPTLTGPPLTPLTPAPNLGIDFYPGPQLPLLYQQIDSSPFPNGVSFLGNNFNPTVNPGLMGPYTTDVLSSQGITLPPPLPQGISPMCSPFTPLIPLNNQGAVDIFPLGPASCFTALNGSPLLQEPCIAPAAPCPSSTGSTLQNSLSYSPFNMFRFPRPTIFPSASSFQGPVANNLPPTCDLDCICSHTLNQGSVCANPALIQQEQICPQIPIAPATFVPNILPGMPNQNLQLFPLQPSCVSQPTLNSGSCSTTDLASNHILPPIPPQSCPIGPNNFGAVLPQVTYAVDCPPITPINISPPCFKGTSPLLPIPFNVPCDNSGRFPPAIADTVPIPINLEINVPPPVIPAPRITIINTLPASDAAVSKTGGDVSFFDYPMPPLIIEGRRSSSRSWLPLVLVALFARDGDCGGCGGGCSDSGVIPIPYPIPIPTNNPVIVNK